MKSVSFELKLAAAAWLGGTFGLLTGFYVNQTLAITIATISFAVGIYAVIGDKFSFFDG